MSRIGAMLLAGGMVLQAQAVAERPAYARVSAVLPSGDLKAYLGDKPLAYSFEVGYDIQGPDEHAALGLYSSYLIANGKAIGKYGGLRQSLYGWRVGADVRFKTPIQGLTPFLGLSMTAYNGVRDEGGLVPNYDVPSKPFQVGTGRYPERKGKFGARVGLEYRLNEAWGVVLDYSFSEWVSDFQLNSYMPMTGTRVVDGVNPVHPSWVALSVQYRFKLW